MNELTLYKKDSTGAIRQWHISVKENADGTGTINIESGLVDGQKVLQTLHITEGKNIGRANETTPILQAHLEIQSRINEQVKAGYVGNIADVKDSGTKGSGCPQAMLAKTYDPQKKQSGSKDLDGYKIRGKRVGIQRKLDGVRRIIRLNASSCVMFTRGGDQIDTLPHIANALVNRFNELKADEKSASLFSNINELWLDGEAYSHVLTFNKVNGITRKGAKTPEDKRNALQIKLHLYDVITSEGYEIREAFLRLFKTEYTVPLETEYVNATEELLKDRHDQYVSEGYEGLMIRILDKPYENKRSQYLLKYKSFEDAEFTIIGYTESSEEGKLAAFIMKMDREAYDVNGKPITEFKATAVGPDEDTMWALEHAEEYIGRRGTVHFFGRSEYGVPRFPRFKDLRFDLKK